MNTRTFLTRLFFTFFHFTEADSCRVTFKEEYDVCENDKSGVDFVKFVGAQYTCEKFLVKGEPVSRGILLF